MLNVIENRRSIRKYKSDALSESQIMNLLHAANLAPSGSNTQPWQFIIVDDEEMKKTLARQSHNQEWMTSAPVYIVCVADGDVRFDEPKVLDENTSDFALKQIIRDTSIAIDHMMLEAVDMGLGTCWIAWFEQEDIRPYLEIPKDKFVVGILTVGYADESPKARPRKDINTLIHRNKWSKGE